MNFLTKKSLHRRTFLRGAGAALALPMLDSMVPAMSAATPGTPRLGWIYVSNGIIQNQWNPTTTGQGFELPSILQPLAPVREHINVLTGLSHLEADTKGDGSGDHTRASAAWLTGVHAYDRTRPGAEVKLATTADQLAAQVLGRKTQIPSLELTTDTPSQGSCDSGDCFYVNTVSWRNESTPNVTEDHPRVIFERLFGDGGSSQERTVRLQNTGSILDSIAAEAKRLAGTLPTADRSKLSEYMDSVRDIETRIQSSESNQTVELELPDRPTGIPDSFVAHTELLLDLQLLAFRADITRVFTFVLARELSGRPYPHIGIPEPHHSVSHHRDDPALVAKKARIDTHHVDIFSNFVQKMRDTPDGDGSLLDHSMIMYGGGMGNGNLHRHSDLPVLLAGSLNGKLKTGYHLNYEMDTPMANLLVTILDRAGVPIEKLGDSTGRLPIKELDI